MKFSWDDADSLITIVRQAAGRAGIPLQVSDITIVGMLDGRGEPTTVTIQYGHELKWVGSLMGLVQGDRTLDLVSQFVMRNE